MRFVLVKAKEVLLGFPKLLVDTFNNFLDDNAIKLGASLSYYTLFSLPPLLIIIISLGGVFLGEEAVKGELVNSIEDLVGPSSAQFIQSTLSNIQINQNGGLAAIIGSGILLFSASTVFAEIQSSINFIWGLRTKPNKGIIKFIVNRLISFSMIVSLGFILMVSLLLNSFLSIVSGRLLYMLGIEQLNFVFFINSSVVFLVIVSLFTIIFKTLPDAKIRTRDAFAGAIFTSILFMIGKYLIGYYLTTTNIGTVFGATASVALLMTWVYYSAIILYFGAEFTKSYSDRFGKQIVPNDYTVLIIKKESELTKEEVKEKFDVDEDVD